MQADILHPFCGRMAAQVLEDNGGILAFDYTVPGGKVTDRAKSFIQSSTDDYGHYLIGLAVVGFALLYAKQNLK